MTSRALLGRSEYSLRRSILGLALIGVTWLLLSPFSLGIPPMIRAVLTLPFLFWLPGHMLQHLFLYRAPYRGFSALPVAFTLSLGVGALAWGVTHILGGALYILGYLIATASSVLVGWHLMSKPRNVDLGNRATTKPNWLYNFLPTLIVFGVLLFWTCVSAARGALFMAETDNWYYLAIVRRIAQIGHIAPGDPYFLGVADPQRGGPWVAMVALSSALSGLSTTTLWEIAPAVLIPIAVSAHYLVGQTLFKDRLAAALACFCLLYGFGRFTWDIPFMVVSPGGIGFILYLAALALAWRGIQEGEKRVLFLTVIASYALASIHVLVFVGLLLALGSFTLLNFSIHRDWFSTRRVLFLTSIAILLSTPFIWTWMSSGPQTTNPIYADEWGLLGEFAGWHVVKPSALARDGSTPWTWSFLLMPILVVLARKRQWAVFLLSTMLFVLATALNPIFVESMLRSRLLPSWGIWRLALQVFQFQFVVGGLGAMALLWLFERMREWRRNAVLRALLLASIVLGFVPSAVPLAKPIWTYSVGSISQLEHKSTRFPFNWKEELDFLENDLPAGSVILTDSNTSYFISAITNHYVVSIPYAHSSPFVDDDEQRRQDSATALDPGTDMDEVLRILDQYQVSFVLLTVGAKIGEHSLSPEAYTALMQRLERDPLRFRRVFLNTANVAQRTAIFAYQSMGAED